MSLRTRYQASPRDYAENMLISERSRRVVCETLPFPSVAQRQKALGNRFGEQEKVERHFSFGLMSS